jgi:hypothetical protein
MGDAIQINHVAGRFSSHTQMHPRPRRRTISANTQALRAQLIAALLEVVAAGGDPRLL